MDFDKMMVCLRTLAVDAGTAVMEIYKSGDFDVQTKADQSPLTRADARADELIAQGLQAAFPDVRLVTEERTETHVQGADAFFIVDPLDGTKSFIRRDGNFTVNIAYVENGVPVRGVIHAPAKGQLFYTDGAGQAVQETGPFDPRTPSNPVPMSTARPDNRALRVVASAAHRTPDTDAYIGQYATAELKSAGSSLKFCLIAAGNADIYPRLGRTMEWDTAAGDAILRAAGGMTVRHDDRTPLVYGKPGFENPFFVAYAPGVLLKPA